MDKWEYKDVIIQRHNKDSEDEIVNKLGSEGWEMITFYVNKSWFNPLICYMFKRKLCE